MRSVLRPSTVCRSCLSRLRHQAPSHATPVSAVTSQQRTLQNVSGQKNDDNAQSLPRWASTPSAMKAPVRLRPKNDNDTFAVNENPERLDEVYKRIFGPGGETWLDESVKWLAVTHKSFDQGRRGFNERLAWLGKCPRLPSLSEPGKRLTCSRRTSGKRMVYLQTSFALLNAPPPPPVETARKRVDSYGRRPFLNPALYGIEDVSHYSKEQLLDERRLSQIAQSRYGLADVVRWKPRQVHLYSAAACHFESC